MIKLKNILITTIAIVCLSTSVFAGGLGFGVKGSYSDISASGSETTAAGDAAAAVAETTKANVSNQVYTGSIYAEYSFNNLSWTDEGNGITFGAEYTPGSADVSDKVKTRNDTELSITGTITTTSASRTQNAQATIDNYYKYYVEVPVYSILYVKAGMANLDVTTKDTTNGANGGTYGNTSLDGVNLGIGLKGLAGSGKNIVWKIAYEQTDFDTLNLTSTTSNKISADLDIKEANISVGYRF